MKLIYIDDLTMFQAGAQMGLIEGRVSQIHKKLLEFYGINMEMTLSDRCCLGCR